MALIANVNRDGRKRPIKPTEFNPYAKKQKRGDAIEVTPDNIHLMREAFAGFAGK